MGIFSSGSKYKRAAEGAEAEAASLIDRQRDIDFGRQLLANIRQQRLAIAQSRFQNALAGEFTTSSSVAGAEAEVNSTLAGEVGYAYDASKRAQQISNLQQQADYYYKKYQKQQKIRGTAIQATAIATGALGGGLLADAGVLGAGVGTLKGTMIGATAGSGLGKSILGDWSGSSQAFMNAGTSLYQANAISSLENINKNTFNLRPLSKGEEVKPVTGTIKKVELPWYKKAYNTISYTIFGNS